MEEARQTYESVWLDQLAAQLRRAPGEVMRLPPIERRIAERALAGEDVHSIAQDVRMSEAFVWQFLENLARSVGGSLPERPVEIAGMGADLDPGVTGGYDDTGFGSIGAPPIPVTEEEIDETASTREAAKHQKAAPEKAGEGRRHDQVKSKPSRQQEKRR